MCAELIEEAMKLPKFRQQIEEALIQVPIKEDPRQATTQTQRRSYAEELVIGDEDKKAALKEVLMELLGK